MGVAVAMAVVMRMAVARESENGCACLPGPFYGLAPPAAPSTLNLLLETMTTHGVANPLTLLPLAATIKKGTERQIGFPGREEYFACQLLQMSSPIAKLSFWGVRGSTPTVDPATWRYGGNTPCLELIAPDGTKFILDCGTGLRVLGSRWTADGSGPSSTTHILVTHYHWDHIQGLPFFSPLYNDKNQFQFYSFRSKFLGPDSLRQVFETQMALPYFPGGFFGDDRQTEIPRG